MKAKTLFVITLLAVLALTLSRPATASVGAGQAPVEPAAPLARSAGEGPGVRASPVMFIQNVGQFADGARFQVRGGDKTIWLAEDALWVTVVETPPQPSPTSGREFRPAPLSAAEREEGPGVRGEVRAVNIKLSFPGANPHPRLEPFNRLETVVSYFIGNDPAKWHVAVPVWGGVRYVDLYPGVDLELTGENGQVVTRLVAHPGADLSAVRLRVEGAEKVALLPSPDVGRRAGGEGLLLRTALGDFTLPLFQVEGGSAEPARVQRVGNLAFEVSHPFTAGNEAVHAPSSVVHSQQAVSLLYAGFLGGSGGDGGWGIAVDASGNAYVTGVTSSSDFPAVVGPDTTFNGNFDAFVAKVNPSGTALVYAGFLGGSDTDDGRGIAVDASGNAYVTGVTSSSNFPTTLGAFDTTYGGGTCGSGSYTYPCPDAFVAKVNPSGTALVYAGFLGGSDRDEGWGIAVDASGNAYVTGVTSSSDFPAVVGPDTSHNGGNSDAFVAKVNPSGTALVYAGFLGGSLYDHGYGIAVDASGNAYVTGLTYSSDFPAVVGPDLSHNGGGDAFVAKVNPSGTALVYAGFLGGSGSDKGWGIAVDASGNAYVTGPTASGDFPAVVGPDTSHNGVWDAFVAKVNPSGTALVYAGFLGGSGSDEGYGIAADPSGNAYVTGYTYSPDFPAVVGPDLSHNGGNSDAFVAKVNPAGTALVYAGFLGGSNGDYGLGIAVDSSGSAYVTGVTSSGDFPAVVGPDTSYNGGGDAFVAKVGPTPTGSLTLLAAPTIPTTQPLAATAQVRNTGASLQDFTLTLRLQQGSATLDTRTFTLSLAGGGTAERTANFGLRPTGRYRVEATLLASGTTLATQSRDVTVSDPNAARIILDYAGDLKAAAHTELNDIAYIPSYALADEILDFGLDKLEEYAVGRFADLAAPIQDAGGIPRSTSGDAIAQIQDKLGRARQYRQNLATAVRLFVRDMYGVTLPDGFDPLNPDLGFITDPWLKDRIKNAIAGYLADFFRDNVISPLWVNGPRGEVDSRHGAFENFIISRAISEPPGLAGLMQHGRDRLRNVVESDAIVTLGPYNILGHTLRYDLTLQEQENKRQQLDRGGDILKAAIAVLVVVGVVIILLLIIGAISSAGALAAVVGPIIWQIVKVLLTISKVLAVATALLVVSMWFTVPIIAPHVPQYHDETLDAAEALIGSSGQARLRAFDVAVRPGQAQLTAQVEGPETGQSQALVETALYSVDGRIIHIVWAPLQIRAGQLATLSKEVPLAPGTYRAVTTLYMKEDVVAAPVVPFQVPGPEIAMSLWLDQPRLSLGQAVQAHVTLTNTSPISDVNDLTLILESTDGVNFDAWPVSLAAGATQRIDYTFTPTTTGAYVLRAWLGIGLNMLAQQDAAYLVGSGPAIALNTSVSEVYSPGVTVTLPLTLTNVGDTAGAVTVTLQTVDRLRLGAAVFTTTVTANVPAGGIVVAEGIALPSASPGLYSVRLDLNRVPYDSRDFAVAASDTLFGLLTVGEMYPAVGQSVPVTATVRSADNTLTDAAITVTVRSPTGDIVTLPMARVTAGIYRGDYTPTISGTHSLELTVAQANYRGVGDVSFLVAESPTLLVPEVEGQPQAREIRPITVTVRSETGVPIPGATVVLSGTQEILRGETDTAGRVVFQTFPPDGRPYVLTTEKMGYAGAKTEVAVGWLRVYLPLVLRNR